MNAQRRVEVYKSGTIRNPEKTLIGYGGFHAWGLEIQEDETGNNSFSVAIVEMDDGSIVTVEPWNIKFIFLDNDQANTIAQEKDDGSFEICNF